MRKFLTSSGLSITVFTLLILLGFVLIVRQRVEEASRTVPTVATAPTVESSTEAGSFSADRSVPESTFSLLLPEREVVTAEAAPSITRNGKADLHDSRAAEPDVALAPAFPETEPVLVARTPCPAKQASPETANANWVPFVYYYRQATFRSPSSFYIVPLAPCPPVACEETDVVTPPPSDMSTEAETEPASPNALVPVFYVFPIYPQPQPVFFPNVVPKRHGAPKLVYPNGVVVKPKVYVPGRPLKNAIRAVTP